MVGSTCSFTPPINPRFGVSDGKIITIGDLNSAFQPRWARVITVGIDVSGNSTPQCVKQNSMAHEKFRQKALQKVKFRKAKEAL